MKMLLGMRKLLCALSIPLAISSPSEFVAAANESNMQDSAKVQVFLASDRSVEESKDGLTGTKSPLPLLHYYAAEIDTQRNQELSHQSLDSKSFFDQVSDVTNASTEDGLICFVPGAFMDQLSTTQQAAQLSATMQRPVLLYDWPSRKFDVRNVMSQGNYINNQLEADRTEDNFDAFLGELDRHVSPAKVTFVGFSKGCYIIQKGLLHRSQRLAENNAAMYKKIILVSPDIDAKTYASQSPRTTTSAQSTEIYINTADTALAASFKVHGKEERLGGAKHTLNYVLDNKAITIIDFSNSCRIVGKRIRHELPLDILAALRDVPNSLSSSRFALVSDSANENLKHLRLK